MVNRDEALWTASVMFVQLDNNFGMAQIQLVEDDY